MRPDYRRVAQLLMAVALLLPLLAACGGDDDDDTTPTTGGSPSAQGTATRTGSPSSQGSPTGAAATGTATDDGTPATSASGTPAGTPTATSEPTPAFEGTPTIVGSDEPTAQPTITPPNVTARGDFIYGYNVWWRAGGEAQAFNAQTLQLVQDSGFNWVRIPLYWDEIQRAPDWWDPLPIDNLVAQYEGSGVQILATVSSPPDWALDPSGNQLLADFSTWDTFMTFMADRYQGKIAAWEIWNEANLASTMGGQVRVSDFAQLMNVGYRAIKSADPRALVVFGGLTPTGVNDPAVAIDDVAYLRSFYELEDGRYRNTFDILGVHANATNNPPDLMYPDNPGTGGWSNDPSFYFRRAEQLHAVMEEFDDSRPVWITEFGWTTANQAPGYEYGADVTEQEQADYLVRAFDIARGEWAWCTGMFVWNLNYAVVVGPEDEKFPWGTLNADWSPRPSYTALQNMPK
jgi:hypothetical protein